MSVPGLSTRPDRQSSGSDKHSAKQTPPCPGATAAVDVLLCRRCSWPTAGGCTCRGRRVRLDGERRHLEAVERAEASGWAGTTRQLNSRWPNRPARREPRLAADPTGRRWIA
jgi:hypothetical protein